LLTGYVYDGIRHHARKRTEKDHEEECKPVAEMSMNHNKARPEIHRIPKDKIPLVDVNCTNRAKILKAYKALFFNIWYSNIRYNAFLLL